jgi:hypothetical protein
MALASLGALIAMSAAFAVNSFMQRDFSSELAESLRVKHRRPLDESDIVQRQRAARRGR